MMVFKYRSRLFIPIFFLALLVGVMASVNAQENSAPPDTVTIAGTIQTLLGCANDWAPECENTMLTYDAGDDLWTATWTLPAGDYEYKAALNGSWDPENYGANAVEHGDNIKLAVPEEMAVTFFYDHKTHWVTDSINSIVANVPGDFQSKIGCPGDWAPDCLRTWLQDIDGDGIYTFRTTAIPAGDYQGKVALNQSWEPENYGLDGVEHGDNIPFSIPADGHELVVDYESVSHMVTVTVSEGVVGTPAPAAETPVEGEVAAPAAAPQPESVTIAGTIQALLGCANDWAPECEATMLAFDAEDVVWQATWVLPAGDYEYKAALNGTWDENYGAGAVSGGDNVLVTVPEEMEVTFFYDHATHLVTDSISTRMVVAVGDYQSELGCAGDWMVDCLQVWLQDVDADGIYTGSTVRIPAGDWKVKVALDQSPKENYGDAGELNGKSLLFTVPEAGHEVAFSFDGTSHVITVEVSAEVVATPEELAPQAQETPIPTEQATFPAIPEVTQTAAPQSVTIAGTLQSELGCANDWAPECENTMLTYDAGDDLWVATWDLPAGEYEYKAALNASWEPENYGLGAVEHGDNIPLVLAEDTTVTFFYNNKTHWVSDSVNSIIANVPGSFQSELGCPAEANDGDWEPPCLRTRLEDPDGDGVYLYYTNALPAGDYELKVAVNQSWDENYGADGAPGGANIPFTIPDAGYMLAVTYNRADNMVNAFVSDAPMGEIITVAAPVVGNITQPKAHWVTADTIAWDKASEEGATYALYYSPTAELALAEGAITGGESIPLTFDPTGLPESVTAQYPHLAALGALKIGEADLAKVPDILKGQFAITATAADGTLIDATSLQIPGVLDELYTYDGPLGVTYDGETPTLRVWAPTAQSVRLHLFDNDDAETTANVLDMTADPATGVWSIAGDASWTYKYYLYEVNVYAPATGKIEQNLVTDPYSFSLSLNSQRSQIVDLFSDMTLMPQGWVDMVKPELAAPEDIVVYELHIRDFSVNDASVPDEWKGTYMAFTLPDSNGMKHLKALADAGLTHVHLLPVFDIATINENKAERSDPSFEELAVFPGDSDQQQAIIVPNRDNDSFNWGYDPFHYTVPEGSYSTNPNGPTRILQFRRMVQGINDAGLRTVMDVVYNHTNSSGQAEKSVLDKVVPGYYHRLNASGGVETSTCCQNTATEHNMMRKLMVDSVVTWAKAYKVDGFRVDLMGHHMKDDMLAVRAALDALTLENDGVDGSQIYVYGEGWDFGEVLGNARGTNAAQLNMGGTGIGTFNDRLRDAARGGSPFGDWQAQGFVNGLYVDPNGITPGSEEAQLERALHYADLIRVGLAGNLADYQLTDMTGNTVTGKDVDYNGSPAGYTQDPQEQIVYVEAHDNQTLFDKIQYAAPAGTSPAVRARMQNMGISLETLSQGVVFYHAGIDMLRSKSFDKNSYNSGDWFNKLDFTYQTNNWAVGLPPASDNQADYGVMQPLLADPALASTPDDIMSTVMHTQEMLQIRKSSKLFRLETAEEIQNRLTFYNVGPDQLPGVIVMSLSDMVGDDLDSNCEQIIVIFNATPDDLAYEIGDLANLAFELHPVLAASYDTLVQTASYDAATGTFTVPAYTTAVFVLPE